MAYIYVITNKINQKRYVGKTEHIDPVLRFKEHIRESRKKRNDNRPLHRALRKYGAENFNFSVLEEVSSNEASHREIYWISELNTYGSSGYNATKGGDGSAYLDYQKIIEDYKVVGVQRKVAEMNNCCVESVKRILTKFNIPTRTSDDILTTKYAKKVAMIDIKTEEVLKTFNSQIEAARYLIENKYSNIRSPSSLSSQISLVVRGKRATCCGFKWERV